jgi:hypothetical protein
MRIALGIVGLVVGMGAGAAEAQITEGAPSDDVEATVSRMEERMQSLRHGTDELDAAVGESYRRLAAIQLSMRGDGGGGARLSITQQDHVGPLYRLAEATYAIDGARIFHAEGAELSLRALSIHEGSITPGTHVLSVVLRYEGNGDVFEYVRGYRFVVRSSHTFVVPRGEATSVGVDAFEHADRAYVDRLDVVYDDATRPLR